MIVSEARRLANQQNARKSTGPQTTEGKQAARRNALKHGLTSLVVAVEAEGEAAATFQERALGVAQALRPRNAWQMWLSAGIATMTIRLDRLKQVEQQVRAGAAWRAISFWDEDQQQEAERSGARLARDPARTVSALRRSPHGCDWLIERWAMLANVAARQPWTNDQIHLAHDLLGTPGPLRGDAPGHVVDVLGQTIAADLTEADLARAQLAELQTHRDRVVEADEIARKLAEADLDDLNNRDLIRLRRYERDLQKQLHWYFEMSRHEAPPATPDGQTTPRHPSIPTPFQTSTACAAAAETKPPVIPSPVPPRMTAVNVGAETNPLPPRSGAETNPFRGTSTSPDRFQPPGASRTSGASVLLEPVGGLGNEESRRLHGAGRPLLTIEPRSGSGHACPGQAEQPGSNLV